MPIATSMMVSIVTLVAQNLLNLQEIMLFIVTRSGRTVAAFMWDIVTDSGLSHQDSS